MKIETTAIFVLIVAVIFFMFSFILAFNAKMDTSTRIYTKDFMLSCDSLSIKGDTCFCLVELKPSKIDTIKILTKNILNIKHQ